MSPSVRASLLLLGSLLVGATADAQSAQRWSVQGSGLVVTAQGSAYEGLGTGVGAEAQARYTPSQFSIGVGLQGSSHAVTATGLNDERVTLSGLFVEPRRIFDSGSDAWAPYVAARAAVLQQRLTVDQFTGTATGVQLNGGGGVLFRLNPRANLDVGATYGIINFADVEISGSGIGTQRIEGSSGTGRNLVLRVGLSYGLR
jgi:hypothetical protein